LTIARSVDVGLTEHWDPSLGEFLEKLHQFYPKNLDHNSGNPLGVSVCQVSATNGHRITASEAYLSTTPTNLTVMTDTTAARILCEGQKAVGIEVPGRRSQLKPCAIDMTIQSSVGNQGLQPYAKVLRHEKPHPTYP